MKTTRSVMVVSAALLFSACGGSDSKKTVGLAETFPASGAIAGWIEDPAAIIFSRANPPGVEIATTSAQATAIVDGDADPFTKRNFVAMGIESYKNTINGVGAKVQLRVWQMPSVAVATELWDNLGVDDARYALTWTTATFGDAGRYVDAGSSWWYNVRKGAYFIDMMGLSPNTQAVKAEGEKLLTAMVTALP